MSHNTRRVLVMNVDGYRRRDRPKKRWMDCVKNDLSKKNINTQITTDRKECKRKTGCDGTTSSALMGRKMMNTRKFCPTTERL